MFFKVPFSSVPVAVDMGGKTLVAIAVGFDYCMALTSDGLIFDWGWNVYGHLGNNTTKSSSVPVQTITSGTMAGKTVVGIAAGGMHSTTLTSNGQIFSWGSNYYGQLGNSGTMGSNGYTTVPVQTITDGTMAGKAVTSIAASGGNGNYTMALTSDGLVYAWGNNVNGQLGDNSTTNSPVPVAVNNSRLLAGKKVTTIAAGQLHSLAMFASGWPPSVTVNPVNQTALSGTTVTLSASAGGSPTPTVQWYVSATGTAGPFNIITDNATATTGTLTLTKVTPAMNGYAYQAVFTNNAGSTMTTAVALKVYSSSPVLTLPPNITVPATNKNGAPISYSVNATDTIDGPLTPVCTPSSGSIFPVGTTTVNCFATNGGGLTSTATFTVTVQRTIVWYQDQYGLLNPDPTADPNNSGVCNLVAYAFGINPSAVDRSQLPTATSQNGYLQISFPRWKDAADLAYVVEVSGNLQNWYSGPDYTQQVSVTPIDATREHVTVSDLIPISDAMRRFIRVKIAH